MDWFIVKPKPRSCTGTCAHCKFYFFLRRDHHYCSKRDLEFSFAPWTVVCDQFIDRLYGRL